MNDGEILCISVETREKGKVKYKKGGLKEYTNQFSLQSKGAVTVEDYWTECQYYDIV